MDYESNKNLFTFIWKIENIRMNAKKTDEYFDSPSFIVKQFLDTEWFLRLYPRGKSNFNKSTMACHLFRSTSSEGPNEIKVGFQLSLVDNLFSIPNVNKYENEESFHKGENIESLHFGKHCPPWEKVLTFSQSSINIVCHMWMGNETIDNINMGSLIAAEWSLATSLSRSSKLLTFFEFLASTAHKKGLLQEEQTGKLCFFPNKCFAKSIIPVERKTFSWSMDDILSETSKKWFIAGMSVSSFPDLLIVLFLDKTKGIIDVSVTLLDQDKAYDLFSVIKVSVSDYLGRILHSTEGEHFVSPTNSNTWHFKFPCNVDSIEGKHLSTLDFPHLKCEIAFSSGEVFSWIEQVSNLDFECQDITQRNQPKNSLQIKMSNFYTAKRFCDATVQLENKAFQAHKAILCEGSPVLRAMFESAMKEKKTNTIVISDLDADTLDRMLMFIYSDTLEDMQFEVAMKLYEAADTYQIIPLKEKCTLFILSNMAVENACPAFCLADAHHDEKLKSSVSRFIFQHGKEILLSEEWKILKKEHVQLANDFLQEACIKLLEI